MQKSEENATGAEKKPEPEGYAVLRGESANKGTEGEAGSEGAVGRRSTVKLLVLLIGVTAVVSIGLVWFVWGSYKHFAVAEGQHHRTIELHGVITHFDEVLTMSARMAEKQMASPL